jgi:hypothetical protein
MAGGVSAFARGMVKVGPQVSPLSLVLWARAGQQGNDAHGDARTAHFRKRNRAVTAKAAVVHGGFDLVHPRKRQPQVAIVVDRVERQVEMSVDH